jgi:hypothetical protein
MNAREETWQFLVLSALIYLVVLGVTGELHASSRALVFFSALWLVQAGTTLWHAWRRARRVTPARTSESDNIPPAG